MIRDNSNNFPIDQSNDPCPIDNLPDLVNGWINWNEDDPDTLRAGFPGYVKTLEDHLESCNYHDWMSLPNTLRMIVSHTPLSLREKERLLKRLCNAVYNLDILDRILC